jgi:hypothetical protein
MKSNSAGRSASTIRTRSATDDSCRRRPHSFRVTRRLLACFSAVAASLIISSSLAGPASAVQYIDGPGPDSFTAYCRNHGYADAKLVLQNAYGWRCVRTDGRLVGISMTSLCREVVRDNSTAILDFLEDFNATGNSAWGCYRLSQVKPLGGLDIEGYCRSVLGAQRAVLTGPTAYNWACRFSNGMLAEFTRDLSPVCQWQYRMVPGASSYSKARVGDFYNAGSVLCYL